MSGQLLSLKNHGSNKISNGLLSLVFCVKLLAGCGEIELTVLINGNL